MEDPPSKRDTTGAGLAQRGESFVATPRWVMVFGILVVATAVLFVIVRFTAFGGQ